MSNKDLPKSVREIADVIGRQEALFLIGQLPTRYSGKEGRESTRVNLYVPKRLNPTHQLVRILGWHNANRLVRAFGGEILYPGNCQQIYQHYRRQTILRMLNEGQKRADIAKLLKVDISCVSKAQLNQRKEA